MLRRFSMLSETMDLSTGNPGQRSASLAYSTSGEVYPGALLNSATRIVQASSELVALSQATGHRDYSVFEVVTLQEGGDPRTAVTPQCLQLLLDYAARSGRRVNYTILGPGMVPLLESIDVRRLAPYYLPRPAMPDYVRLASDADISPNTCRLDESGDVVMQVGKLTRAGMERAFIQNDTDQRYGAVVVAASGNAYYHGQVSSLGGRTTHAEMTSIFSAHMEGETEITDVGLVCTRYADKPAEVCGCCRQFLADFPSSTGALRVHRFSSDGSAIQVNTLAELLPNQWSNTYVADS
jgi:cytidine deaminase